MNFMQLLQSLDDLLYEVMSWLVFFPVTLWKTVRHPQRMMEYARLELRDPVERQYEGALSPPLFLLLALLLSHALELGLGTGTNPIVASNRGLAAFVDTDTKLLALRLAIFSLVPMVLAVAVLVGGRRVLTHELLQGPFYAQCYPAAAFALTIGIGGQFSHQHKPELALAGSALMALAMICYFSVQIVWFKRHLDCGFIKAASYTVTAMLSGFVGAILLALLFSGTSMP